MELRKEFVLARLRGDCSVASLCEQFGVSRDGSGCGGMTRKTLWRIGRELRGGGRTRLRGDRGGSSGAAALGPEEAALDGETVPVPALFGSPAGPKAPAAPDAGRDALRPADGHGSEPGRWVRFGSVGFQKRRSRGRGLVAVAVVMKAGIRLERIDPGKPFRSHERMHAMQKETTRPAAATVRSGSTGIGRISTSGGRTRRWVRRFRHGFRAYPQPLPTPWFAHAVRQVRSDGSIKWGGRYVFVSMALAGEAGLRRLADLELGLLARGSRKCSTWIGSGAGRGKPTRNGEGRTLEDRRGTPAA